MKIKIVTNEFESLFSERVQEMIAKRWIPLWESFQVVNTGYSIIYVILLKKPKNEK